MIESPISDLKLDAIGVSREKMLERIASAMRFADEHGIRAAFFGVDSTRAEPDFYRQVYETAVEAGAKEVAVVDTLGIASPEAVADLVGATLQYVDGVPVHFHGHDDFGLATASAVAAVRAGATWIHGTINGMGERAGNADLGEIAIALRALYGVETGLRFDRIREAAARVQELSGYGLAPWKPLTGETLFRRESGAVASQFHDPPSIEPYSSELVGAERAIVLGKKSGLDSIRIKVEELGLDVPEERWPELLAQVKELGRASAASSPTTSSERGARQIRHADRSVTSSSSTSGAIRDRHDSAAGSSASPSLWEPQRNLVADVRPDRHYWAERGTPVRSPASHFASASLIATSSRAAMIRAVADYDAVIVGSGVNSLACAALLARADWRVCVLERNDWFGGAIKTEELTEPGFLHDVFSAWHPLWVGGAAHAELGDELAARGLEYLNTELPTATAFPDGGAAFLLRTAEGNTEELGPEWPGVLEALLPQRRPRLRRPRHRALVAGGARARREGRAAARPRGRARVPRRGPAVEPRLARDDVRLGARARPARAVGAAHRARARPGDVRLHDAGDRGRGAGGRDARAARRRREARRRARAADPRPRRRLRDRPRRRARARALRPGGRACGSPTARRSRPSAPSSRA